jgi:hypothetical protein
VNRVVHRQVSADDLRVEIDDRFAPTSDKVIVDIVLASTNTAQP